MFLMFLQTLNHFVTMFTASAKVNAQSVNV